MQSSAAALSPGKKAFSAVTYCRGEMLLWYSREVWLMKNASEVRFEICSLPIVCG
jgi:hypothetical protein